MAQAVGTFIAKPVFIPVGQAPTQAIVNMLQGQTKSDAMTTLVSVLIQLLSGGKPTINVNNVSVPIESLIKDIVAFKSIDWEGLLAAIEGKKAGDWADMAEVAFVDVLQLVALFVPEAIFAADALEVAYPIIKWFIDNWKPSPNNNGGGKQPDFPAHPPEPPPPTPVPPPPGPIDPNPVNPDYHPSPWDGRFSTKGYWK
jgi:hypothetical protein